MSSQGTPHHSVIPRTLLFLRREGQTLLLEGGPTKWFAGKLNGLGGGVEPGEDVFCAAMREAVEETGLTPTSLEFRGTVHVDVEPAVLLFVFAGELPRGDLRATPEGVHRWISDTDRVDDSLPFVEDVRGLMTLVDRGETFHTVSRSD